MTDRLERARVWADRIKVREGERYFEGWRKAHDIDLPDAYWRAWWLGYLLAPVEVLELTSLMGTNPLSAVPFPDLDVAQEFYARGVQARVDEL